MNIHDSCEHSSSLIGGASVVELSSESSLELASHCTAIARVRVRCSVVELSSESSLNLPRTAPLSQGLRVRSSVVDWSSALSLELAAQLCRQGVELDPEEEHVLNRYIHIPTRK